MPKFWRKTYLKGWPKKYSMILVDLHINNVAVITKSSIRCQEAGLMPGKIIRKLYNNVVLVGNARYAIRDIELECE